jgi:selenium-binding protein 1
MPSWWSSDADDGELLSIVHGIIDTWSAEKATLYAAKGYVHYHELLSVADGSEHPTKVVWLKHTARTSFYFDLGPHPELAHDVTPGVDYEFIPNGAMPYNPGG